MNTFKQWPKFAQWVVALLLLVFGFLPVFLVIEKGSAMPWYYGLLAVYVPIAQFAFTPIFKLTGVYRYFSPMLLGYMANERKIDLHSGTSFDYLLVMRNCKPGHEMKNRLLRYYVEGLLQLAKEIEEGQWPESVKIEGTSYFFNESGMKRLGFEVAKPTLFYRVNLYVNFIDLMWMYSLSKGKWGFPKLSKALKVTISGAELVRSKGKLEKFMAHWDNSKR